VYIIRLLTGQRTCGLRRHVVRKKGASTKRLSYAGSAYATCFIILLFLAALLNGRTLSILKIANALAVSASTKLLKFIVYSCPSIRLVPISASQSEKLSLPMKGL